MEGHGEEDIEIASDRLANLSVCDGDRSPLTGIPFDSPRIRQDYVPTSKQPNKSLKSSDSESEHERDLEALKIRFNKLVKKAKHLAQEGNVQEALELNKQALQIHYHAKLAKRIAKMEEYLKNYGGEEEEEDDTEGGMVQLGSGFYLHKDLVAKLYNHQKHGVLWMWGLHKKNKGGILGDDMGLGKTIQVIAFLSGLFDMDKVRTVMIIVPVSVMVNWEKEFSKWAPGIAVHSFHGTSKRERERTLNRIQRRGGVMLTTYGMVLTSYEQLSHQDGRNFVWDYVILDEGHKIKNPSKTTKAIHGVPASHRIILTGTPIQNNLKELWSLFDYVHQGALLGTLRTFKMEFENPIIRARERDATAGEKRLGMEMAQTLKKIIDPYFLLRTKASVNAEEKKAREDGNPRTKSIRMPDMTFKNDFVVWLFLSDTQLSIYRDFLELDSVKELLMSSKSPLVALTVLKKICDHPRLLSLRACHQLGMLGQEIQADELDMPSSMESAVTKIESLDDAVLVGEAGKMRVLVSLVDHLREEGHRALIFSQSRRILDIIQKVFKNRGHKVVRLDGTVKGLSERDELVQKFQKNKSYSIFLLTTQVGGVGLTLTAADRVIIYDPSWNPATDAQAVDRAFRIGQTKNVVIYRLITCGTVEEKIYRRQIFKDSITRQATGNTKDPYRYFTKEELRELFQLGDSRFSNTQQQLEELHGLDRRRDPELDSHIAFLHSLDIFGISDHDLMFSQESPAHETEEVVTPAENLPNVQHQQYIMHRVQKAKEIIERESSVPGTMEERMKSRIGYSMSVYSQPENQALMSGVPVFQPNPADSNRMVLNRPGGGAATIQPKQAKPPQEIIVYPTKPVVNPTSRSSSTSGSSTSEPIDLTQDEMPDTSQNVTSTSSRSSDTDHKPVMLDSEDEETTLPKIEKRKRSSTDNQPPLLPDKQEITPVKDFSNTPPQCSPSPPPPPSKVLSPQSPAASTQTATGLPPSPEGLLPSRKTSHEGGQYPAAPCITPKQNGRSQQVIDEELIISPNSYTPLMMTRQKRQKRSNSPVANLTEALEASHLVMDSSLSTSQAPDEIASFLAEDDRGTVDESFVAQDSANENEGNQHSQEAEELNISDSEEPVLKPNRRRSVCRRVAVIESSEDEYEDEENKENIDPSFSSVTSPYSREELKEREEESDDEAEEEKENVDTGHQVDEGGEVNGMQSEEEESPEEDDTEEELEEDGEISENVKPFDETTAEKCDGDWEEEYVEEEAEQENEEEDGEEEDEEEEENEAEEEEAVDMDLLTDLLRDGKTLYRQKRYTEAAEKCQAALSLMYDPQIEAMLEKIKSKIQAS